MKKTIILIILSMTLLLSSCTSIEDKIPGTETLVGMDDVMSKPTVPVAAVPVTAIEDVKKTAEDDWNNPNSVISRSESIKIIEESDRYSIKDGGIMPDGLMLYLKKGGREIMVGDIGSNENPNVTFIGDYLFYTYASTGGYAIRVYNTKTEQFIGNVPAGTMVRNGNMIVSCSIAGYGPGYVTILDIAGGEYIYDLRFILGDTHAQDISITECEENISKGGKNITFSILLDNPKESIVKYSIDVDSKILTNKSTGEKLKIEGKKSLPFYKNVLNKEANTIHQSIDTSDQFYPIVKNTTITGLNGEQKKVKILTIYNEKNLYNIETVGEEVDIVNPKIFFYDYPIRQERYLAYGLETKSGSSMLVIYDMYEKKKKREIIGTSMPQELISHEEIFLYDVTTCVTGDSSKGTIGYYNTRAGQYYDISKKIFQQDKGQKIEECAFDEKNKEIQFSTVESMGIKVDYTYNYKDNILTSSKTTTKTSINAE